MFRSLLLNEHNACLSWKQRAIQSYAIQPNIKSKSIAYRWNLYFLISEICYLTHYKLTSSAPPNYCVVGEQNVNVLAPMCQRVLVSWTLNISYKFSPRVNITAVSGLFSHNRAIFFCFCYVPRVVIGMHNENKRRVSRFGFVLSVFLGMLFRGKSLPLRPRFNFFFL